MTKVNLLVANASGTLTSLLPMINKSFKDAVKVCEDKIKSKSVDVIVLDADYSIIPELGVGGYTPAQNIVYIYLDPKHAIKEEDLYMGILHELHHAARWSNPGYGSTLKEALLTEGMATLYEEEVTGTTPIYAKVDITEEQISMARKEMDNDGYDHYMWFISGNDVIPRWFGYSYGYKLALESSKRLGKTASELVHETISKLLPE